MSSKSRRKSIAVVKTLADNIGRYSFIQVVRLLERSAVFKNRVKKGAQRDTGINTQRVGRFAPPNKEVVRFSSNPSLAFPENDIESITKQHTPQGNQYWKVLTNFIALTGSMGILPFHYSELLLRRLKQRDKAIARYFDLFNHRITSLFYQASIKYRLPLKYENEHLHSEKKLVGSSYDNHTFALLSLIGLGGDHLSARHSIRDESLIFYSGLLSQQIRTASGLKQLISDYFSVNVSIEEFVGQWQDLIDDVRTRMPYDGHPHGQNSCLGRSSMLGRRGWFAQGKVRISIGPLTQHQHQQFAPGGNSMKALNELVRLYLGMEREYEFEMLVNRKDISDRVSLSKEAPPIMGWSTWLSGENSEQTQANKNLMKITVSSH